MFADEDDLVGPLPTDNSASTSASASQPQAPVVANAVTLGKVKKAGGEEDEGGEGQGRYVGGGSSLAKTLAEKLLNGQYECAMCMSGITLGHQLWSCHNCYGVFHLTCTQSWARANPSTGLEARVGGDAKGPPLAQGAKQFRCPTCRFQTAIPQRYECYCGSAREPRTNPALPPGSCGGVCSRRQFDVSCTHKCPDVCHPGPCSDCHHKRQTECYCGRHKKLVGCSSGVHGFSCDTPCGKKLDCGKHECTLPCHEGPCSDCEEILEAVECHCGASTMERRCSSDPSFGCGQPCPRRRTCGNHDCTKKCHKGECDQCERDVKAVKSCACGQTPLWQLHHKDESLEIRTKCTDPIPTCGNPCGRPLGCGQHFCEEPCHDGPCKPCLELVKILCQCGCCQSASVRCFCGYLPKDQWRGVQDRHGYPKKELLKDFPWTCDRRCKVTKTCGRHKCENTCCGEGDEESHICFLECKKKAPCGVHVCGQLCHKGPCPPCSNTSFQPLSCQCKKSVLEPPVPCGTPPPACNHPCSIKRKCGHPSNHVCHPEGDCPPCVVSMEKRCGSHNTKMDWHSACHQTPSCGKQCGKPLKCCGRACAKSCHGGPCVHKDCKKGLPELSNLEDALGAPPAPTAGGGAEATTSNPAPAPRKKGKKNPWGT